MKDGVRIGVIGCGAMGRKHLELWPLVPGASVTAVCDADAARATAAAKELGAAPFDDVEAMAASGLVDAVDICTPSGLHASQGMVAARYGLHLIVEKPLDLSFQRAAELVRECQSRGLTLACIFQRRTLAGARAVADAVRRGALGRLLSCSAYVKWWRPQSYYGADGWRGTRALDGGVLANQAIHALDHLCWLAGRVVDVEYARVDTLCHQMEAEDHAVAVMRFESGARGVIEASTCCSPDLGTRVEVFGTEGSAAFEDARVTVFGYGGQDRLSEIGPQEVALGGASDPMAIGLEGHRVLFEDFVKAIRTGQTPMVPGQEALMAVEALNKIYEQAGVASFAREIIK
ncbi:MAG: Gfo/Idh/MocA family protein [Chthonomonadales bacterium]